MSKKDKSFNSFKGHPLEGDGTLVNLFHYLWKKNRDLQSCPLVRVPPTIVYEHNFPRGWYFYDSKHKEMRKKTGKDLDTNSIYHTFSKQSIREENVEIVAGYLSRVENEDTGEEMTSVEFFDKSDNGLQGFLFKREKREQGILQKFVMPKGLYNSVIQAIWSPHVTLVERRNNIHKLTDKKWTMYERAVTYEGPAHYSNEVFCAPQLVEHIKKICASIVDHFLSTEHKNITRMVLYFKVDAKNNVWLLWSSSLRISDKTSSQLYKTMPLNLSPKFIVPEEAKGKSENTTPPFNCPNCSRTYEAGYERFKIPLEKIVRYFNAHRSGNTTAHNRTSTSRLSSSSTPKPSSKRKEKEIEDEIDQKTSSRSETPDKPIEADEEDINALKIVVEDIVQQLDDLLYEAYSHFLTSNDNFEFMLPKALADIYESHLKKLFDNLYIRRKKEGEDEDEESTKEKSESKTKGNAEEDETDDTPLDKIDWVMEYRQISIGKLQREFSIMKDEVQKKLFSELMGFEESTRYLQKEQKMEQKKKVEEEGSRLKRLQSKASIKKTKTLSGTWTERDCDDATQVPDILRKFLPDLTDESYEILCQEPVFLSRDIGVCEECFLKFTACDGSPKSPAHTKRLSNSFRANSSNTSRFQEM